MSIEQTSATKKISKPAHARADCWNHVGVGGDGTCSELTQVGHCRNCPVYAEAGASFFDRPMPVEYQQEWTDVLRKQKETHEAGTQSIVVFQVGEEWLALPTTLLREVSEVKAIHRVPHRSNLVLLGMVNIRGEIQLCISLAGLLQIDSTKSESAGASRRMIVTDRGTEIWVFPVDRIHGSHRIDSSTIVTPPSTIERGASKFTKGVVQLDRMQVGVLDDDLIYAALRRELE